MERECEVFVQHQLLDGGLFVMLAEGFIVVGIERGYDEPLA